MTDGSSAGLVRADQLAEEARGKRVADEAKWAKLGMCGEMDGTAFSK